MMTLATFSWATAGVIVGGTHSLSLKHTCSNTNEWAAMLGLLRIAMIG